VLLLLLLLLLASPSTHLASPRRYAATQIKFNLIALCKKKSAIIEERLAATPPPSAAEAAELHAELAVEVAKYEGWRKENVRRKHNYIPLAMELLKVLAEAGKLAPMVESAKQTEAEARAAQKARA